MGKSKKRYAVVNPPFEGKHKKPQDPESLRKRHLHWLMRRAKSADNGGKT